MYFLYTSKNFVVYVAVQKSRRSKNKKKLHQNNWFTKKNQILIIKSGFIPNHSMLQKKFLKLKLGSKHKIEFKCII